MHSILTITAREFRSYFLTPIAYVYLITFVVVTNWIFFRSFFVIGQADMRPLFGMMPWIFLFFAPAVSMGRWSEERKQGTMEFLLTLPIKSWQAVMGKFLSGLLLIAVSILLLVPAALSVALVGDIDWGPVIGGCVGTLFLGGAYLSIGLFFSALTENQIISFILGVLGCFLLFIIGTPLIIGSSKGLFAGIMQYAALGEHFSSIAKGVLDTRDIIYYCSVIAFFLYLNCVAVKFRAKK